MHLEALYLASERKHFTAKDDGREIEYMTLYAWIPETNSFKKLKVQTDLMDSIESANLTFGDKFTCTVTEGVDPKGTPFLKVIEW